MFAALDRGDCPRPPRSGEKNGVFITAAVWCVPSLVPLIFSINYKSKRMADTLVLDSGREAAGDRTRAAAASGAGARDGDSSRS